LDFGSGSGKRVALYACDLQMSPAHVTAAGGTDAHCGADGTVFHGSRATVVTQLPANQIGFPGDPATLTILASSSQGTLQYRWRKDGWPLTDDGPFLGSATPTLSIDAATPTNQGSYDVWRTDDCGDCVSAAAALVVASPGERCPGDTNCDKQVTLADTDPFVEVLLDPTAWTYPCTRSSADCNDSGAATFADIDPFVAVIGTTCP
jgi:hypothetical protein